MFKHIWPFIFSLFFFLHSAKRHSVRPTECSRFGSIERFSFLTSIFDSLIFSRFSTMHWFWLVLINVGTTTVSQLLLLIIFTVPIQFKTTHATQESLLNSAQITSINATAQRHLSEYTHYPMGITHVPKHSIWVWFLILDVAGVW